MYRVLIKLVALILVTVSASGFAKDIFTFSIGVEQWKHDASADIGVASDNLLLFGTSNDSANSFDFEVSHKLPILPSVRFSHANASQSGANTLATTYVIGGEVFSVASNLTAQYETSSNDLLLYYPAFDVSILKLDVGLLTRFQAVDINVTKVGDTQQAQVKEDKMIPMLHVNLQTGIPLLGFFAFAEFNEGSNNSFYKSGIGYTFDNRLIPDVDVVLGYRKETMSFDRDDGVIFQQDLDATYAGLTVRF